jgi:hypothetical protein
MGVARPSGFYGGYDEVYPTEEARAPPVRVFADEEEDDEDEDNKPKFIEVNQKSLMKDQERIQQELHHEIANPPSSISTTFGGRRKHQLGSMATEANDNMALYEAQKIASRNTRNQTKAKYGW